MSTDEPKKRNCCSCWPVRRTILSQAAAESTAHGLSRTVGDDRHWVVRLIWVLAFLAVVGLLLQQLIQAVKRLASQPVSTSVLPNADQFVFPDIHICPYPMISASYSATMSDADLNYTNWQIDRIARVLRAANISGEELSRLTAQIFTSTVPYSFLVNKMGMRMEQTIIGASVQPVTQNLALGVDIVNLHHYKFLNCFTVRMSSSITQSLLSSVMGYLDISLFADATYNTTLKLANGTIDARGLGFLNYDIQVGSGFRLYFTERGRYPDDYSTSVAVSTGFHHFISLSMGINSLSKDKKQCASDTPAEKILNPATLEPVEYTYSLGSCYSKSLSKIFRELGLNCYIPGYGPIMYEDRKLICCNDFTKLLDAYYASKISLSDVLNTVYMIQRLYNGSVVDKMVNSSTQMQSDCAYGKPCDERIYEPAVASVLFPLRQGLGTELITIFKKLTSDRQSLNYSVPGRVWMVNLFNAAYGPNGTAAAEQDVATAAVENIVRLQIQAGELSSTMLKQDISYTFSDLMAGVGGLMGLFMGGSVLTLLELVELGISLVIGRRITRAEDQGAESAGEAPSGPSHLSNYQHQQQRLELCPVEEIEIDVTAGKTYF